MTDQVPGGDPGSSITPDKLRGRLAEDLREALARGETPSLRAYARRYGLAVAEVGRILEGLRALAFAAKADGAGPRAAAPGMPRLPDDYEILGELGRGAMGVVYRARQRSMDRVVAVKVLRPDDVLLANLADRFRREVKALAKLRHPHIVAVHEVGEADGHLFFSMDLVEGRSLHEVVHSGEMTPTRAVRLLRQVASAIAYTHGHGLVHRDLKPGNILVDGRDDAYVVDFGLAQDSAIDARLTGTGQILGTPAYMSPEQAKGDAAAVGEATDVYSMGAVLYECLTRRAPFEGRSLVDTIRAVVEDDPVPPRRIDARIPRDLEVIVQTAMAKEPQRRYASAQALQEDLERFVEGLPIRARPAGAAERLSRWTKRNPALAASVAGAFVFLATGLGVTSWLLSETTRERNEKSAALADRDQALSAERSARERATKEAEAKDAALQRERGARLVAQSAECLPAEADLAVRVAIEAARRAPGPAANDALRRALAANRKIRTMAGPVPSGSDLGSAPRRGFVGTSAIAFGRDLRRLYSASDALVQVWDRESGRLIGEWPTETGDVEQMLLSPDGRRLLVAGDEATHVVDVETGRELARLADAGGAESVNAFSPDGSRLAGAGGVWDAATGRRLFAGSENQARRGPSAAAFSPDGGRLAAHFGGRLLVLDARTCAVLSEHAIERPGVTSVAWTADGPLAFSATLPAVGPPPSGASIVVLDVETGTTRLTLSPRPDDPLREVERIVADESGSRVLTWSGEAARVWDARTGRQVCAIRGGQDFVGFSPDGRFVVLEVERRGPRGDVVRAFDAESGRAVGDMVSERAFFHGPDGTAISRDGAYLATADLRGTVHLWALGAPLPVLVLPSFGGAGLRAAFTDDGRRVVLAGAMDPAGGGRCTRVCDASTGGELFRVDGILAALGPGGRMFGIVDGASAVVVNAEDGRELARFAAAGAVPERIAFDASGTQVVITCTDGAARVGDLATGREVRRIAKDGRIVSDAVFAAGGRRVVLRDSVGQFKEPVPTFEGIGLEEWDEKLADYSRRFAAYASAIREVHFEGVDLETGETAWTVPFAVLDRRAPELRIVRGGRRIAVWGSWSVSTSVLDTASGAMVCDVTNTGGDWNDVLHRVHALALSPDGKRLARQAARDPVGVFDAESGAELLAFDVGEEVSSLTFSANGDRLAAPVAHGPVLVWDLTTGGELARIAPPAEVSASGADVVEAGFSPDGERLLVLHGDGSARVWPLSPLEAAVAASTRELSTAERLLYVDGCDPQVLRRAASAVAQSFAGGALPEEAVASVRADARLPDAVRIVAIELASTQVPDPDALNSRAWTAIRKPGASAEDVARALRWAREAARLVPSDGSFLNTCGVAEYQLGDYAAAAATLAKSNALQGIAQPSDLAFLALAQWKTGRTEEARGTLGRMRDAAKSSTDAADAETAALLREAEETIGR